MEDMSTQEQQLCAFLRDLPRIHKNRYKEAAENELLRNLFWSLAGGSSDYLRLFFPDNVRPFPNTTWKLRKAQGGADGDEFTEAARGKSCGHIFKSGEATYRCKTCGADDTCVLCSKCYDSSDHNGHMVYVSVSSGNSGCCDCGDPEAWRVPVHCAIHTPLSDDQKTKAKGKAPALPQGLAEAIRMTIGRVFDFICDVISCSPEQFRLQKTKQSILLDEKMSRLTSRFYGGDIIEENCEFALLLWNDEKHTVIEVRDQVARACKVSSQESLKRAYETDDIGRSIIKYSYDVDELLKVAQIIEQIKVTVTIRSARDTFREQMCGTIVEWLSDIAGCSVGSDHDILRRVICEEMLKPWSTGSHATNVDIGMNGIDDHEKEELDDFRDIRRGLLERQEFIQRAVAIAANLESDTDGSDAANMNEANDEDDDELDSFDIYPVSDDRTMAIGGEDETESDSNIEASSFGADHHYGAAGVSETDVDGDIDMGDPVASSPMEDLEAIMAGYPLPPFQQIQSREIAQPESNNNGVQPSMSSTVHSKFHMVPLTPHQPSNDEVFSSAPRYWLETPAGFLERATFLPYEDLWNTLRLDWMILFDLRMWKKVRIGLRDLYISTIVSIPEFKRILGLRFAGLYTTLAQLYLIADREPDHSIINISLQILTTPSITCEIVQRGNFLTKLMAILYTFLTTRQVGHPYQINPNATLAFDSGSVTNRRMYHFFMDLKYLFGSEYIQKMLCLEEIYTLQFLDLVKLHQGICPNIRAVGEHVEYETDAWISASLITREINRLCRQFSESFKFDSDENYTCISRAIRTTAKAVIFNSLGAERKRFTQNEIKEEIKFKKVDDYEFDIHETSNGGYQYLVVKFDLKYQPISFHHALHYTLSWLIEYAKNIKLEKLIELLSFTSNDLFEKSRSMGQRSMISKNFTPEDHLMTAFDYPLRVCAWLAQMKAGMWVRNGMSLRHQMSTYRGVNQRDVSHHRDIFLLQIAMVVCPPDRVLASAIDRYGLEHWMKGIYEQQSTDGVEDSQILDVVEDLIHLLIVLLSDRTFLANNNEGLSSHVLAMRRDIIHVLCFKPLPFSDICNKLPDKFQDQEECQDMLDSMTTFKPPEGLSDVGTFELKPEYSEEIDPYISHYNKNQREESENVYKAWMAKKTGIPMSEIVYEPRLQVIESGAFSDLAAFTRTGLFAQIIYYCLLYALKAQELTSSVPMTRVEAFLQVVLHLVLIAVFEDRTNEELSKEFVESFIYISLTRIARSNFLINVPNSRTIASILEILSRKDELKACHPKILLVLKKMRQKYPRTFEKIFNQIGEKIDRISTLSPVNSNANADRERKKQAALARQAKVMAQFQQQQKTFLDNQGDISWGDEDPIEENIATEDSSDSQNTFWQHLSGTCILCQEETKDSRLYGTFALMKNSTILRQTDFDDSDFLREVINTPASLDHCADHIRPFGVAGENHEKVKKIQTNGTQIEVDRHFVGKGFPPDSTIAGPVSVGCGHIMHYRCFAVYYGASLRRQQTQIARHHPEDLKLNEFICPLCKALGNSFLPVVWSPKIKISIDSFESKVPFNDWLNFLIGSSSYGGTNQIDCNRKNSQAIEYFMKYNKQTLVAHFESQMPELLLESRGSTGPTPAHQFLSSTDSRYNSTIWGYNLNSSNSSSSQQTTNLSPLSELVISYRRLTETMFKNQLPMRHFFGAHKQYSHDGTIDLAGSDTLAKTLGFSISAVEIQQRGVASLPGTTFLETIPQQVLAHLRALAETASSFLSIGGVRSAGENCITKEFITDCERQLAQLFLYPISQSNTYSPLFKQDTFVFLTECSLCLVPMENLDIMHIIRLCYLAEIVKVILKMGHHPETMSQYKIWLSGAMIRYRSVEYNSYPFSGSNFQKLCCQVYDWTSNEDERTFTSHDEGLGDNQSSFCDGVQSFQAFVKKYALAFLRKVVLLLHARYGALIPVRSTCSWDMDELDRLTEALKLPSFSQICSVQNDTILASLVKGWISKVIYKSSSPVILLPISVSHPTIFELVGLPKNYDILMEEAMKRRCPTTGKDVSDPMLCLFCGVIICGQSVCCLKQGERGGRIMEIGGGQQHVEKCQKNIALFLNIRKCCVFYVHNTSGSWTVAPYINKYGEVDPGLRHSRQLFLNQKRYDALLRSVWLSHGIPSIISRKLEMDMNNGGWETI
ncbi:E3 ubiquitin-protein ligase ubr11 [Erysiphe necator]|nr:E3 ubiquitin-protein ligase ubr11 [Erysiphe necator]